MKRVIFSIFRHGLTEWNIQKRFQGHTDIPLCSEGKEQARELKNILLKIRPEIIYSSDLIRAIETAKISSEGLNIPIEINALLREAFLGEPEGMFLPDVLEKYGPDNWEQWGSVKEEHMDFCFPGGETKRAHQSRLMSFLESIASETSYQHIAISSHGGSIRRIIHYCEGAPLEPIPIKNCQVHQIEWDSGKWKFKGTLS